MDEVYSANIAAPDRARHVHAPGARRSRARAISRRATSRPPRPGRTPSTSGTTRTDGGELRRRGGRRRPQRARLAPATSPRPGKRVLVLEARAVVGGGCATEGGGRAWLPAQLPLELPRDHPHGPGLPRPRARALRRPVRLAREPVRPRLPRRPGARLLAASVETTAASVARFSKADAETFRELAHAYRDVLEQGIIPAMFSPPGPPSRDLARSRRRPRGSRCSASSSRRPNHVARDLFESPEVQTWLGFWVAQLAGTGDVFGLGANYPVMLAGSLEPYGWAICVGGSNRLAQAMVRFLEDHGGEVRLDSPVARIEVAAASRRAVDARRRRAHSRRRGSSSPTWTRGTRSSSWSARRELRGDFARACRRWRYDAHVDVLRLPRARRAGPLEGRRLTTRQSSAASPSRCASRSTCSTTTPPTAGSGVPPRQPGLFTVHPSLLRAEPLPAGQGGVLLRADRAVRAARGRPPRPGRSVKDDYAEMVLDRWRPYLVTRPRARARRRPLRLEPDRHRARHAVACGTATGTTAR